MSLTEVDPRGTRPGFVSIAELSSETGIAAATLRCWRRDNYGPASFKMGGRIVYRRSEIARWLAEQETQTKRGGDAA
ncbi:helix-turn-helix domain-containing protein [Rhodococcus kroppenstedtii]|uniref:helix-turn-helix transcriptional regulator n=1 Tax=Rhodococcoides kroppenstedtii TaxID=293050 RepID=UPI0029540DAE|nr:helix-turn-helix domain-containing protein [Rhodococcus kroppenstedtii]MDV7197028.1 helix-turn-helix domain-containing protein [Rhodococcus kroppenstedtii]